jgi:hypothetical protein
LASVDIDSGRIFGAFIRSMSAIAFDTLKPAQRLEAAGLPPKQAQDIASALAETIGDAVVNREYLDLRLGEMRSESGLRLGELRSELELRLGEMRAALALRLGEIRATMAIKTELAEAKGEVLKSMFGADGLQTHAILGGVAALFRLLG